VRLNAKKNNPRRRRAPTGVAFAYLRWQIPLGRTGDYDAYDDYQAKQENVDSPKAHSRVVAVLHSSIRPQFNS
jgi:hypothetical protein